MSQPHVLYVAWGFPSSRGGGVYRALATANGFARAGFRVTVLTATRETFLDFTGADESLEAQVDPSVRVVRIPFDWPVMETDLRAWPPLRAITPRTWRKRQLARDVRDFPEIGYGPWRLPLQAAALAIHREDPVDLCVATANPNVAFMAASALHEEAGVPYVMDYRDAWMLDVFDGGLLHADGGREDTLERALLASAQEVWFVNEPIRAWHERRHPRLADRLHVVANGFDPEFAPRPRLSARGADEGGGAGTLTGGEDEHAGARDAEQDGGRTAEGVGALEGTAPQPSGERPLTFGYIGTASAKVPLAEFAAGWRLARSRDPELRDARAELWGYLGFYSTPNPALLALVEEYAPDGLSYRGPVAKTDVQATYETFDACLLILGAGAYVTSGKVFEYAATALPIVSIHDPGNAASDVLRGYPLWFPVADVSPESIAGALASAAHAARTADEATRAACAQFARQYARDLQLAPRIEALREFVTAGPDREATTAVADRAPVHAPAHPTPGPAAQESERSSATPSADDADRPRRIVVLDSGRGIRAATVAGWRAELGLRATDELRLLSWQPPAEALPLEGAEGVEVLGPDRATTPTRARRIGRALSRRTSRLTSAATARVTASSRVPAPVRHRLAKVDKLENEALSARFAAAVLRSSAVGEVVRNADLLVPVDVRSQRAAWTLARRHPEPAAVSTVAAARRVLGRPGGA